MIELGIKIWSSITYDLPHFHRILDKAVVGLCFIYSRNPNNHCSGVNLDERPSRTRMSPMDRACALMVGYTIWYNSSNSLVKKLVRILKKPRLDLIDPKTSRTLP